MAKRPLQPPLADLSLGPKTPEEVRAELMLVATHQLRAFTAELLSPDELRALKWLAARDQLIRETVTLALPEILERLAAWRLGEPERNLKRAAYAGRSRWEKAAPRRVTFYRASRLAARLWGGVSGELRQPLQLAHDLAVSTVYFRLKRRSPAATRGWISEDMYRLLFRPLRGEKVPDAALLDEAAAPVMAIEVVGRYSKERLESFARSCIRRGLEFEIW